MNTVNKSQNLEKVVEIKDNANIFEKRTENASNDKKSNKTTKEVDKKEQKLSENESSSKNSINGNKIDSKKSGFWLESKDHIQDTTNNFGTVDIFNMEDMVEEEFQDISLAFNKSDSKSEKKSLKRKRNKDGMDAGDMTLEKNTHQKDTFEKNTHQKDTFEKNTHQKDTFEKNTHQKGIFLRKDKSSDEDSKIVSNHIEIEEDDCESPFVEEKPLMETRRKFSKVNDEIIEDFTKSLSLCITDCEKWRIQNLLKAEKGKKYPECKVLYKKLPDLFELYEKQNICLNKLNKIDKKNKDQDGQKLKVEKLCKIPLKQSMSDSGLQIPKRILNLRKSKKGYECEIEWALFENESNSWEAYEDIPEWFLIDNADLIKELKDKL